MFNEFVLRKGVETCNTLSFKTLCSINDLFDQTTDLIVSHFAVRNFLAYSFKQS